MGQQEQVYNQLLAQKQCNRAGVEFELWIMGCRDGFCRHSAAFKHTSYQSFFTVLDCQWHFQFWPKLGPDTLNYSLQTL